jgi:hypothetical protein
MSCLVLSGLLLLFNLFQLSFLVDFYTLFDDLTESLDLVDRLFVLFLHFLDYLKWSMFLTEHFVGLITVLPLDLHTIVSPPSALDME